MQIFSFSPIKINFPAIYKVRDGGSATLAAPFCGGTQKSMTGDGRCPTSVTNDVSLNHNTEERKDEGRTPDPVRRVCCRHYECEFQDSILFKSYLRKEEFLWELSKKQN